MPNTKISRMVHTLHACAALYSIGPPSQASNPYGDGGRGGRHSAGCHLLFSAAAFSTLAFGALMSFALRVCPCSRKLEGLEGLSSVTIVPPLSSHATTEIDALAASPRMLQYPMKSHRCSSQLRAGGRATCEDSLSINRMVVCSACSCRRERSLSPSPAAAGGSPHAASCVKGSAVQRGEGGGGGTAATPE
eukprot:COSAG01_NODE_8819_length_2649_cov_3.510588_3_plen_190_part_01